MSASSVGCAAAARLIRLRVVAAGSSSCCVVRGTTSSLHHHHHPKNLTSRGGAIAVSNFINRKQLMMMSTLIVAEPIVDSTISAATCSAVTAAQSLQSPKDPITLLVVSETQDLPSQVPSGVTHIVHYQSNSSEHVTSESIALAVADAVKQGNEKIHHVVGTSTKHGSSVIPRAAAVLNSSPVTDVVQILSKDTFVRPMYAGNVLAKVQNTSQTVPQVLTIRPTSYDKATLVPSANVPITTRPLPVFEQSNVVPSDSNATNDSSDKDALVDLGSARVVVSGGRGMKEGSNFALLKQLAVKLDPTNASVGASRAAVDAGMAPNDWQVGQTGKVVAPDLYVAVGISGAIQHLSGMKDSKVIVAINKDPDAPIFQVADYGLVADLFAAVPELTTKL